MINFDEIIKVLDEELLLYKEMKSILKEQQNAMVKVKIDIVELKTAELKNLMTKMIRINRIKNNILNGVSIQYSIPVKDITLSFLKQISPSEYKEILAELFENFIETISEVEEIKATNNYLIQNSLYFIHRCFNDLEKENSGSKKSYTVTGKVKMGNKSNILVNAEM